eukprot:scaffold104697_cov67-Phaeocystis_antarctica.AAC.2
MHPGGILMHPSGIFMCAARLLVIDAIEVLHSARARVGELENLGHVPRTDVAVSRLVEHLNTSTSAREPGSHRRCSAAASSAFFGRLRPSASVAQAAAFDAPAQIAPAALPAARASAPSMRHAEPRDLRLQRGRERGSREDRRGRVHLVALHLEALKRREHLRPGPLQGLALKVTSKKEHAPRGVTVQLLALAFQLEMFVAVQPGRPKVACTRMCSAYTGPVCGVRYRQRSHPPRIWNNERLYRGVEMPSAQRA